ASARPADRATLLQATRGHQRLVETHWFENDAPRMLDAGLRALNLAETVGPSPELVRAYATASLAIGSLPIHPLAERYAQLAMETAESVGDPAAEAYARFLLCVYRIGTGDWARVDADLERALAIWEALGDPRFAGDGQTVQAMSRLYRGEHARAAALFEEVEALGRRFENVQHRAWGLLGSAEAALRSGRPDAAEKALDTAAALLGESPGQLLERFRLEGLRAQLHLARGALGAAEEAADRAEARGDELAVPTAHYLLEGYAGVVEARLAAWRAGGAREARRAARRALRRLRLFAAIFRIGAPRAWTSYAEAWELEGKRARARAARRRARARAEALGMRWEAERAGGSGAAGRAGDARAPGPVGRTP
ncbi:MAG TPA: hypothetical protein RMH85_20855, partial [Polyangiaceae bacterium LLY-WYZ-15_(1-7)]|nr:hypothetical protein [Polyangiaceae bacterium LLY-WYZ-15_(1-7)]